MLHLKSAAITTAAILALSLFGSERAQATLTLTSDGVTDGFGLTTFLSGYGPFEYGPLAQGIDSAGHVITGSFATDRIYVFNDVDNQILSNALSATPYTFLTGNPQYAMTTAAGVVYGAQAQGSAPYEAFSDTGAHTPIAGLSATGFLGMWADPVNGHIIAASEQGLIDIDPIAGTFRVINGGLFPDGVSVSADGLTAYVANAGCVQSYSIATGAFTGLDICGHSPDGTGVITGGNFNGDVIVNDNDGTVGLINPTALTEDIIASGGTRGDFVSPDTSNGTLFLSQEEAVDRLSCGPGCSIGSTPVPTGVPEPSSLVVLGTAIASLCWLRRRRGPSAGHSVQNQVPQQA